MRRRRSVLALLAAVAWLTLAGAAAAVSPPAGLPAPAELLAHVNRLTAEEMEGRGSGTAGGDRAARYLAEQLAAMGLAPGGDGGTYLQPFTVGTASRIGGDSVLERTAPSPVALVVGRDWTPHGGSPAGEVTGELLALGRAGYGAADARGKIVVALEPGDGKASRLEQLIEARRRGAAALLLVGDALPSLDATAAAVRLPSAALTRAAAAALVGPSRDGRGVTVRLRVSLARDDRRAANVIGLLPGVDPARASEAVVVGAHYDHLGRSGGSVHPGADDNASGTAVVLGLARAFAAAGGAPRTLVFALFSGEEIGLLGSAHYTRHPAVPLSRTVAMLNFDMVGRMRAGGLTIAGLDSATDLRARVEAAVATSQPAPSLHDSPFGPSDHSSFYSAGVPVLFLHTGTHADYHTERDTADKIDADGLAEVARVGARLVAALAGEPRPPAYAKVSRPDRSPRASGGDPGGAFLGVAVSPREDSDGLSLGSIVPGSAAERAGLRHGDVIVRLDDTPIGRFEDLRRMLAGKRPGDPVSVLYLRDGEDHRVTATLGTRP